jgi:hypothetical protein
MDFYRFENMSWISFSGSDSAGCFFFPLLMRQHGGSFRCRGQKVSGSGGCCLAFFSLFSNICLETAAAATDVVCVILNAAAREVVLANLRLFQSSSFHVLATQASVKKVVTCSRKMAILSHKIKITTIKIKKPTINEKEQAYFL